jgi:haloalkane dehalogenase
VRKLLFTATPGGLMSPPLIAWCRSQLPELEVIDVGAGIHYLQEDQPHAIGRGLADWLARRR